MENAGNTWMCRGRNWSDSEILEGALNLELQFDVAEAVCCCAGGAAWTKYNQVRNNGRAWKPQESSSWARRGRDARHEFVTGSCVSAPSAAGEYFADPGRVCFSNNKKNLSQQFPAGYTRSPRVLLLLSRHVCTLPVWTCLAGSNCADCFDLLLPMGKRREVVTEDC